MRAVTMPDLFSLFGMTDAWFMPTPSLLFEEGWTDRMLASISVNQFSPEATFLVVAFFVLFAVALLALFFMDKFWRKQWQPGKFSTISNHAVIREQFQQALTQRAKISLAFHRLESGARSTDAVLVDVRDRTLTLEISSRIRLSPGWIGRQVDCDFRLRQAKQPSVNSFYAFLATIQDYRSMGEVNVLNITMPATLELRQKRANLRIEPPARYFQSCLMWLEDDMRGGATNLPNPATWGEPTFRVHVQGAENMRILNISGGGMRLAVPRTDPKAKKLREYSGKRLIVRIELQKPEDDSLLCYAEAQAISGTDAGKTPVMEIGLQFIKSGRADRDRPGLLVWNAVNPQGIPEIDDWVFRVHLDIYRNKGM